VERRAGWARQDIALIGLGATNSAEACRTFFQQTGRRATYPLYRAPWVGERMGIRLVPTLLVFDAEGREVFRTNPREQAEPLRALDAHLATLLAAR